MGENCPIVWEMSIELERIDCTYLTYIRCVCPWEGFGWLGSFLSHSSRFSHRKRGQFCMWQLVNLFLLHSVALYLLDGCGFCLTLHANLLAKHLLFAGMIGVVLGLCDGSLEWGYSDDAVQNDTSILRKQVVWWWWQNVKWFVPRNIA